MRVTFGVSCFIEERLQIHSLMEHRNANETFKEGSGAVVFDILAKKFIKYL